MVSILCVHTIHEVQIFSYRHMNVLCVHKTNSNFDKIKIHFAISNEENKLGLVSPICIWVLVLIKNGITKFTFVNYKPGKSTPGYELDEYLNFWANLFWICELNHWSLKCVGSWKYYWMYFIKIEIIYNFKVLLLRNILILDAAIFQR